MKCPFLSFFRNTDRLVCLILPTVENTHGVQVNDTALRKLPKKKGGLSPEEQSAKVSSDHNVTCYLRSLRTETGMWK